MRRFPVQLLQLPLLVGAAARRALLPLDLALDLVVLPALALVRALALVIRVDREQDESERQARADAEHHLVLRAERPPEV